MWLRVRMIGMGLLFASAVFCVRYSYGRDRALAGKEHVLQRSGSASSARLLAGDNDLADWMSYGRTYSEQRFSPLKQIRETNVSQLKPAWEFDLDTFRGQEETPLVVDGVMFFPTPWGKVFALNARTGKLLWSYDPKGPKDWVANGCCGPINRGVAVWDGKVYVGTLNGHLVALDARNGKPVWDILTIPPYSMYAPSGERHAQYLMDGAPRVVKGEVIVGNGGGDSGLRGYLSAYDAETGRLIWRFYTVPGDPSNPGGSPAMKIAAKTWNGEAGRGGAVWDSIAYDPALDLLYFGTGNPGSRTSKGGDRLFGDSVVAVKPETGEYAWHYQEVPDDAWDYDATAQIILADLKIDNQVREVLLHAQKDGFFYVLDRASGKPISAEKFATANWATGVDLKTGRPMVNPEARRNSPDGSFLLMPGALGAHSWQAMSYSPATNLVYIPVMEMPGVFAAERYAQAHLRSGDSEKNNRGALPNEDDVIAFAKTLFKSELVAWDPVKQREAWHVKVSGLWTGGTLATAGNLVFQGDSMGDLAAYQADSGVKLWSASVQTAIIAPPITYEAGGQQYVAVAVGWGGALGLTSGPIGLAAHIRSNRPRIIAFKLNGKYRLPDVPLPIVPDLNPPPDTASAPVILRGEAQYRSHCASCHGNWGISAGVVPDLRYSSVIGDRAMTQQVVHCGTLRSGGMPMFGPSLSDDDLDAIRAYIIHRAHDELAEDGTRKSN
jgi:quinohemoprotein ethanol dehydrogenase